MAGQFKTTDTVFRSGPYKRAHNAWKKKLLGMYTGKRALLPGEVTDHHTCDFGQWYFKEGKSRFGQLATFRAIDEKHQQVHKTAREVAELFHQGKKKEARNSFMDLKNVTHDLFTLLD